MAHSKTHFSVEGKFIGYRHFNLDNVYIYVYTLFSGVKKMQTVKVFQSGNSQAVRIPKNYQIKDIELFINQVGSSIIFTQKKRFMENF